MFGLFGKKNKEDEKLFFSTDIHSHVVPGIDDGARNMERALGLVDTMVNWGIKRIIATPHVTQDTFENTPEIIEEAFGQLKEALTEKGMDVDISHSAEYRIDGFFIEQLEKGLITPLPNNYLIVENSYIQEPWNLDHILFDLSLKGYKPILAHPERYMYYHEKNNRHRYREIHDNGILFQINLLSLTGYYGKAVKKVVDELIDEGMVDFIGTDLHNRRHVAAIDDYIGSRDYRRHRDKLQGVIKNDIAFL